MNSSIMAALSGLAVAAVLAMMNLEAGTQRPTYPTGESPGGPRACDGSDCSEGLCADEPTDGSLTVGAEIGHERSQLATAPVRSSGTRAGPLFDALFGGREMDLPACSSLSRPLCPDNLYCADDSRDGCVPGLNAVDCPGVCILPPLGTT